MRNSLPASLCALALGCSVVPGPSPALPPGGDVDVTTVTLLYGQRKLADEDFWGNVDETDTVGVEIDHRARGAWVGFEIGTQLSDGEDDGQLADIDEIYAGVRKTFDFGEFFLHPYIAVGATYIQAQASVDAAVFGPGIEISSDDESVGGYGRVGVFAAVANHLHIGLEYRAVFGTDIELFGTSTDADYQQFGLTLGYAF